MLQYCYMELKLRYNGHPLMIQLSTALPPPWGIWYWCLSMAPFSNIGNVDDPWRVQLGGSGCCWQEINS